MNIIIWSTDNTNNHSTSDLGGKAASLAQLGRTTIQIPPWFVLTPHAFALSLSPEQKQAFASGEPPIDLRLAPTVATTLSQALDQLCPTGEPVAVRSSALDEDGAQHSFAGQLESFLEHGLSLMADAPAVLIQHMVQPTHAGIAFSADPITGRRTVAVVAAVRGTADQLVTGQVNGETFKVDRAGAVVEHQALSSGSILNAEEAIEVAQLARKCQQYFGRPQDIEWARADGTLYLLQSRPITTLAQLPDPDGTYALWDNSNIAESYPGITTPLTFSFARRAYSEVYRQLCRVMGVSGDLIHENSAIFEQMVGLINGRIYYNLMSWYRALALLPGYKINSTFMENMMGVSKKLPEHLLDGDVPANPSWIERAREIGRAARAVSGLFINFVRLPSKIERFYQRLERALALDKPTLEEMRLDELVQHYRSLDQQLLTRWDAPLINDFFLMIFYGLLGKLCQRWCDDDTGALQNKLLTDIGDIISTKPARYMQEMAHVAQKHPLLVAALQRGTPAEIAQHMAAVPDFTNRYKRYLAQFGDRCMEELKLESATLRDDPLPLLRSVGAMQVRLADGTEQSDDPSLYQEAMIQTKSALAEHPIRSIIFNWVLGHARRLVKNRENLRFERTRLFGRVRAIFQNIGRRFVAEDVLADADDIFFLNVDEILHFVEGTTTCTHLSNLAQVRKHEFNGYHALAQSNRFETFGAVHVGNRFETDRSATTADPVPQGDRQLAIGCSPGLVRGPVRVIQDPRDQTIEPGDILVAERTDPGWITLLAVAAGLIVEHGSLLSHSAIVSREMGLPSVVALPQATQWLTDGDWVELDGTTGRVTRLKETIERK